MSETYAWDKFYPDHTTDNTVQLMIEEDVSLVQGSGVKERELPEALGELSTDEFREKVLEDLLSDGYVIRESDISEFFDMEGDTETLDLMMDAYTGLFSSNTIYNFITCGSHYTLSELLGRAEPNVSFTTEEIIEIINLEDASPDDCRILFRNYHPQSMDLDTVTEFLECIPEEAYALVEPFIKMLPFEDRVEIRDIYF